MVAGKPGVPVVTLPTAHSPFFAAPKRLADVLAGLANS
jgi:hypothetical protein